MDTLQTFELFPELPDEIRFKIWRMSSNDPCLVIVTKESRFYNPTVHKQLSSLLATNHEARSECMWQRQKPVFAKLTNHPHCSMDPEIDTLFIKKTLCHDCGCLKILYTLSDAVHNTLKTLAISSSIFEKGGWEEFKPLRLFRNLEKIIVIASVRASTADSDTFRLVDAALDIYRSTREAEIAARIDLCNRHFEGMSREEDPSWKVPVLEYKIRMNKTMVEMQDYYEEGQVECEYDDGYSNETSDRLE